MAWSENVNHFAHTVDSDLISIGALNTDDSEAVGCARSHGVTVSLQPLESAERTFR